MSVSSLQIYDSIRTKIGESEARSLVEYIESRVMEANDKASKERANLMKLHSFEIQTHVAEAKAKMLKRMFIIYTVVTYILMILIVKILLMQYPI